MLNIQQQTNRQNHTSTTNLQNEMKKQKKGPLGVDSKIQDQVKTLLLQGGADLALTAKIASVKVKFFKYCQGTIFSSNIANVIATVFFKDFQCQGTILSQQIKLIQLPLSRYNFSKLANVKIRFFKDCKCQDTIF